MNAVNKTLYIPLYGKAFVSRKGLFLSDKKAEEIWSDKGFALKGKSASKWLAYYLGIRAAVFDSWLRQQLCGRANAVVLHIGCGLDSRVLRVKAAGHKWYDVDLPAVIRARTQYYTESADYSMIAADLRDSRWLAAVPERGSAVVVMEGVSMYLSPEDLQALAANLCAHFDNVALMMDCYTPLGAKMSKFKNPVHDVGVTQVYGMDGPELPESGGLTFVQEENMSPDHFIAQLRGFEKFIFKKLYAGGLSKKLYKLYTYKKERT